MLTYLIYKGETQMTTDELKELLKSIQKNKCESQVLELKRAEFECPKRLYQVSQIKIRAEQLCSEFMKKTTTKKWVFTIRMIFRKK